METRHKTSDDTLERTLTHSKWKKEYKRLVVVVVVVVVVDELLKRGLVI